MSVMLKQAYTPRTVAGMGVGGSTPGMTPGMKKRVTFVSTPAGSKTDKRVVMSEKRNPSASKNSSITDGLL